MSDSNNTWSGGDPERRDPYADRGGESRPGGAASEPTYGAGSEPRDRPLGDDGFRREDRPVGDRPRDDRPSYGESAHAPYDNGPYAQPKPKGMAITALVLGILALLLTLLLPPLSIVLGIVALILGIIAMRRASRGTHGGRGMAITGLVLGIIGTVLGAFVTLFLGAALWALFESGDAEGILQCAELPTQAEQEACIEEVMDGGTGN